jgi:hypothetical protein
LRFAICDLRFAICDLRFAICDLQIHNKGRSNFWSNIQQKRSQAAHRKPYTHKPYTHKPYTHKPYTHKRDTDEDGGLHPF